MKNAKQILFIIPIFLLNITSVIAECKLNHTITQQGGFENLRDQYIASAKFGDAEAQFCLGKLYNSNITSNNGYSAKNYDEVFNLNIKNAIKWYTKSANQGYPDAQYSLASMYIHWVVDIDTAIKWKKLAARNGHNAAQYSLGEIYETGTSLFYKGEPVKTDIDQAIKWYKMSAKNNNINAVLSLAEIYFNDDTIKNNYRSALEYFNKTIEIDPRGGNAYLSYYYLGMMYENGFSLPRDYSMAYAYFNISSTYRHGELDWVIKAKNRLDSLESKMTPSQIERGQQWAREWNRKL